MNHLFEYRFENGLKYGDPVLYMPNTDAAPCDLKFELTRGIPTNIRLTPFTLKYNRGVDIPISIDDLFNKNIVTRLPGYQYEASPKQELISNIEKTLNSLFKLYR